MKETYGKAKTEQNTPLKAASRSEYKRVYMLVNGCLPSAEDIRAFFDSKPSKSVARKSRRTVK